MENNQPNDDIEAIINWTLPGLRLLYRDADLNPEVIAKYTPGKIFRSPAFVDVSGFAGKPVTNCRFVIASSKAAPLFRLNPDVEKWMLHTINANSYFKILDVYHLDGVTQILVLQIPPNGIDFFSRHVLKIGEQIVEEQIIAKARESLHEKINSEVIPALQEKEWLDRTSWPPGLDPNNEFFGLEA
ncbi:MAG: hypothetical protein EPGJADBJ_04919 [Saprospiraceae bacterium]|nr:hypothetical protein [Saprospiraceae bacterium]